MVVANTMCACMYRSSAFVQVDWNSKSVSTVIDIIKRPTGNLLTEMCVESRMDCLKTTT